jgi:hypothetical protein
MRSLVWEHGWVRVLPTHHRAGIEVVLKCPVGQVVQRNVTVRVTRKYQRLAWVEQRLKLDDVRVMHARPPQQPQ